MRIEMSLAHESAAQAPESASFHHQVTQLTTRGHRDTVPLIKSGV
jgi:hypothetical protein